MAEEKRTILLDIQLNTSSFTKEANEALTKVDDLKKEQEQLRSENKQNTVEYKVLQAEISKYNKIVSDNAKNIVRMNELMGKEVYTRKELFDVQKILAAQYNALTDEQLKNEAGAQKIAQAYKEVNESLQESGREVGDYRLLVGNYQKEMKKALKNVQLLKEEQNKIGFVIDKNKDQLKDLNDELDKLDNTTSDAANTEARLRNEINNLTQTIEQQDAAYNQLGQQIEETEAKNNEVRESMEKIGFVTKDVSEIIDELKEQYQSLQDEIKNTSGDTSALESKLEHTGKRLQSFGVDISNVDKSASSSGSGLMSLGETMEQLTEKGLKLDFGGVMDSLNNLSELSKGLDFKTVINGAKTMGTTLANLGRSLLTNPIFLIAATIKGIVVAFKSWGDNTKVLEQRFNDLNKKLNNTASYFEKQNFLINSNIDLENQLLQLREASFEEIRRSEQIGLIQRMAINEEEIESTVKAIREISIERSKAYNAGNEDLMKSYDEQRKAQEKHLKELEKNRILFDNQGLVIEAKYQKSISDQQKEANDEYKRLMEERLRIHQEAIRRIAELDYANKQGRLDLEIQTINDTIDLQKRLNDLTITNKTDLLTAQLKLEKERYDQTIALRETYANNEIKEVERLAAEEIKSLKATGKDRENLVKQINEQTTINILNIRKKLNDDILNEQISFSEEEKKILENQNTDLVNDYSKQITALNAVRQRELNKGLKLNEEVYNAERQIALKTYEQIENDNTKSIEEKALAYENYQAELIRIEQDRANKVKEINDEINQNQIDSYQKTIDTVTQISDLATQSMDLLFSNLSSRLSEQSARLDKEIAKNTEALKKQYEAGFVTEQEYNQKTSKMNEDYDKKKLAIEKEQFEIEKAQSIAQTSIQTALAIMQAFGQTGPIAGAVLAGIVGAIGATQIALISAQKFPGYAEGGKALSGKRIGSGDGVPFRRSNGDNLLASVKMGEVILNEKQQQALGGDKTFRAIGVPGFAGGGVVATATAGAIQQETTVQRFVMSLDSMPRPVVSVEDINSGLVRTVQVVESSQF